MMTDELYKKQRLKIIPFEESLLNVYELFTVFLLTANENNSERYYRFFIEGSFTGYQSIFDNFAEMERLEWNQVIQIYLQRNPQVYYPYFFVATLKLIENNMNFLTKENDLTDQFRQYLAKWSAEFTGCKNKSQFDNIYKKMAEYSGIDYKTREKNNYYGVKLS